MNILYLECNMGAAGDMLMSALYELLPDREGFVKTMNGLGLPGVRVEPRPALTCGIAGTRIKVTVAGAEEGGEGAPCAAEHSHDSHGHSHLHDHDDHVHNHGHEHSHGHSHEHSHATPGHIGELIEGLPLPEEVRRHAAAVYGAIAAAEAKAHGCDVGDVHFHEVGALDAVTDVAGVCYAMYLLSPDKIVASPVHVGSGTVRCAHGVMPVPVPAAALLLEGIPSYGGTVRGELCTPTGAALLSHFVSSYGPMPAMVSRAVGCGVGKKKFEQANCVRAFWGTAEDMSAASILELVCNIDDMSPEALAFACGRLLQEGALDVYTTPGVMKKGRPGQVLTVLCPPEREQTVAQAVLRQTTTNGLRVRRCGKYFLSPRVEALDTPYGSIRIKCAEGWGIRHRKPEFEDVAEAARRAGLPFQTVWEDILTAIEKI